VTGSSTLVEDGGGGPWGVEEGGASEMLDVGFWVRVGVIRVDGATGLEIIEVLEVGGVLVGKLAGLEITDDVDRVDEDTTDVDGWLLEVREVDALGGFVGVLPGV